MAKDIVGTYSTDAGMVCLWDQAAFTSIVDYEMWESELCDDKDIRRHIKAGHFVPINTNRGIDGTFDVWVRLGSAHKPPKLTAREEKCLLASSPQPYRLMSSGQVNVSALELVSGTPDTKVKPFKLIKGCYAVTVCFIAWDDEPGMKDKRGRPKPGALPDFILLVTPDDSGNTRFRNKVNALDDPK